MRCCWSPGGIVPQELLNGSSPAEGLAPAAAAAAAAAAAETLDGTMLLEKQQHQGDKASTASGLAVEVMTGSSSSSRSNACDSAELIMPDLPDCSALLDHDLGSAYLGRDVSNLCYDPDLDLAEILRNDSWDAKIWDQQMPVQGSELINADSGQLGPSDQQQGIMCSSSSTSSNGDLALLIRSADATTTLDMIPTSSSPAQALRSPRHVPDLVSQQPRSNSVADSSSDWDHGMLPSYASTTSSPQQQQRSTGNAGSSSDQCQPCRVAAAVPAAAAAAPSYTPMLLGCPDQVASAAGGSTLVPPQQQQQQQQQSRPSAVGLEPKQQQQQQQQQQQPDRPGVGDSVLPHPRVQQAAQQHQQHQPAVPLPGLSAVVGASGPCIDAEMARQSEISSGHLRWLQRQDQQQQQQQEEQQFLPADPLGLLPLPGHDGNGGSRGSSPSTSVLLTNGLTLEAYLQAHARLQRRMQAAYQAGHLAGTRHYLQQQQQQRRCAADQQAGQQPSQQQQVQQRQREVFAHGACKRPRSQNAGAPSKKVAVSIVQTHSPGAAAAAVLSAAAPARTARSGRQVQHLPAPSGHRGIFKSACKETANLDPAAAASGPPAVPANPAPVLSELLASDRESAKARLRKLSDSELLLLAAQAIGTKPLLPPCAAVTAAPAADSSLAAQPISTKPRAA